MAKPLRHDLPTPTEAWASRRREHESQRVPGILANAGVLKGKKATVFPSEEDTLANGGALRTRQNVVVDGKIVTAPGPQAAQEFAEALAKLLQ